MRCFARTWLAGGSVAALLLHGAAVWAQTAVVDADATIRENAPATNFGAVASLSANTPSGSQAVTLLRLRVSGLNGRAVLDARLRLQVASAASAGSDSGGSIHPTSCTWTEPGVTWSTRPAIGPLTLATAGAVQHKNLVDFNVTPALPRDGLYCFALVSDSRSGDEVVYNSREAKAGIPTVRLTLGPLPTTTSSTSSSTSSSSTSRTTTSTTTSSSSSSTTATISTTTVTVTTSSTTSTAPPCPPGGGSLITLSGTFTDQYSNRSLAAGTVIDARAATFLGSPTNSYPIDLDGCPAQWVGGDVLGQYDRSLSWSDMHTLNNAGIAFLNSGLTVDGIRIDDVADGIRPRAGGQFTVRNAWLSYIRDDCIENDHVQDGLVDDSLFDGCYNAFSARPSPAIISSGYDGRGKVWTIQNSLVRLEPMPGPDGTAADNLGTGGFFKWHLWGDPVNSLSPQLALYGNVFLAERVGVVGADRMGIPPGELVGCANNVMVWLGPGDYPAVLPPCFTVTTDRTVWDNAVAAWISRHSAP